MATIIRALCIGGLLLTGCHDADDDNLCPNGTTLRLNATSLLSGEQCSGIGDWMLSVELRSNGVEHSLTCVPTDETFECQNSSVGATVTLNIQDSSQLHWHLETVADALPLDELAVVLTGPQQDRDTWLSNGFQSWSMSGALQLGGDLGYDARGRALADLGDQEVARQGREFSWWHTWVAGGNGLPIVAGASSARRFKTWISVSRADANLTLRLHQIGVGEQLEVPPQTILGGDPLFVQAGELEATLQRYAATLESRSDTEPRSAPAGWNSWYQLWDSIDASAILDNAVFMEESWNFESEDAPLIVVDDGWQQAWGIWEPNTRFPAGLTDIARQVRDKGFEPGVWLAPYLVSASTQLAQDNPDWFVPGAMFPHPKNGEMLVLDPTHPEAAAYMRDFISTIVGWGYKLLKIDFLFAGTYPGARHDGSTAMEGFARGLEVIREAAGSETLIVGVGSPGIPILPYVDGWRAGGDIALEVTDVNYFFGANQARSLMARWPLCQRTLCDADPALTRTLSRNEVEVLAWVAALGGGAWFSSDDWRSVEADRFDWAFTRARYDLGRAGRSAIPLDPIPETPPRVLNNVIEDIIEGESQHIAPSIWRLPTGGILEINWSDNDAHIPARSAIISQE